MKKLLLTTTAMACLASASAFAEMSVKLHGKYEFQAGTRHQKSTWQGDNLTTNQKNAKFDSNARVGVLVESKTDHGMTYGANVMLTPKTPDNSGYESSKERSFLFAQHNFGRVELGSNFDVVTMMNIGADSVASATGGASDGDWANYFRNTLGAITNGTSFSYRNSTASGVEGGSASAESERRVSYMTPVFNGFQFGASYTPDTNNKGSGEGVAQTFTPAQYGQLKNAVSLALAYNKQFSGMDFAMSLGYDFGGLRNSTTYNKLNDYNVGLKLSKNGLSFAASYGDAGKSLTPKVKNVKYKQNYYTVGLGYAMNKYSVSLTHMGSKNGSRTSGVGTSSVTKLNAFSLGMDYMVASGLKTYAEVTTVSIANPLSQQPNKSKNNGTVVMAGAVVKF